MDCMKDSGAHVSREVKSFYQRSEVRMRMDDKEIKRLRVNVDLRQRVCDVTLNGIMKEISERVTGREVGFNGHE